MRLLQPDAVCDAGPEPDFTSGPGGKGGLDGGLWQAPGPGEFRVLFDCSVLFASCLFYRLFTFSLSPFLCTVVGPLLIDPQLPESSLCELRRALTLSLIYVSSDEYNTAAGQLYPNMQAPCFRYVCS